MVDPEKERTTITQLIGECIMAWAHVERVLTILYSECVGAPPVHRDFWLHAGVFESVISIDTRMDMIETALRCQEFKFLKAKRSRRSASWKAIWDEWKPLRTRIRKKYNKRNEIAHSDISDRDISMSRRVRLLAFPTLTRGQFGNEPTLLDSGQLKDRKEAFGRLAAEIVEFRLCVALALKRLPESALPHLSASLAPDED